MKRVISFVVAMVLCFSLSCTVFADEFVQSITDKGAPEIVPVKDAEGKDAIGEILDADGNIIGELSLPPYNPDDEKSREAQVNAWLNSMEW